MLMRYIGGGIGHVAFDLDVVFDRRTGQEVQDDEEDELNLLDSASEDDDDEGVCSDIGY